MGLTRRLAAAALVGSILLALALVGCEKSTGERVPNLSPETTLSYSPEQGSTASYRVRMNWFGWDPDGSISHFMTKWDTLDWVKVVNTDSIFLVSAADTVNADGGFAYHTFSVKAVDNEGAEDETPETVTFTAFTFVPETSFLPVGGGPTGVTGPMVNFNWQATDRDGVIAAYQYHLLIWDAASGVWTQVLPDPLEGEWVTVGPDVTTFSAGPLEGRHRFEVRAIDDAGAADQTPARREFTSTSSLAGAILTVYSNVFGTFKFRGPVWPPSANDAIPIFAGERLRFRWEANAQDYGGQVIGYRHAYDDTSTWPAWSIFDTRFNVAPDPGDHSLYISSLDNSNVQTRGRIRFDVVEAELDDYILIVDDWDSRENYPPSQGWGSDDDRTSFYDLLLAGYARDRVEWEPSQHLSGGAPQPPGVETLRGASTVIWYADHENTTIAKSFDSEQVKYNALAGYVRVGGNLILCGQQVIRDIVGSSLAYPFTATAADTLGPVTFVRDFLHVGYAANSGAAVNPNDPPDYGFCFYGVTPAPGWEDDFEPIYIDSVGAGGYPEMGKWPLYVRQSPAGYVRCGLPYVDRLQSFQGTGAEIYLIDSHINTGFEGEPGAVLYLSGDNHGNSCFLGFPLYYCQYDHVKSFIDKVLLLFGEEKLQ